MRGRFLPEPKVSPLSRLQGSPMRETGADMKTKYKETSRGGLQMLFDKSQMDLVMLLNLFDMM